MTIDSQQEVKDGFLEEVASDGPSIDQCGREREKRERHSFRQMEWGEPGGKKNHNYSASTYRCLDESGPELAAGGE